MGTIMMELAIRLEGWIVLVTLGRSVSGKGVGQIAVLGSEWSRVEWRWQKLIALLEIQSACHLSYILIIFHLILFPIWH